jgi:hypothetical protein
VKAVRLAKSAAKKSAIPVVLLGVVIAFLLVQHRVDRNDPKLALAPVFAEPDLAFPSAAEGVVR